MPTNSAVREMLPPNRLICATAGASSAHPTGLALTCAVSDDPAFTVVRRLALADGLTVSQKR